VLWLQARAKRVLLEYISMVLHSGQNQQHQQPQPHPQEEQQKYEHEGQQTQQQHIIIQCIILTS
jgi:hypothetical protein